MQEALTNIAKKCQILNIKAIKMFIIRLPQNKPDILNLTSSNKVPTTAHMLLLSRPFYIKCLLILS